MMSRHKMCRSLALLVAVVSMTSAEIATAGDPPGETPAKMTEPEKSKPPTKPAITAPEAKLNPAVIDNTAVKIPHPYVPGSVVRKTKVIVTKVRSTGTGGKKSKTTTTETPVVPQKVTTNTKLKTYETTPTESTEVRRKTKAHDGN